MLTTHKQTEHSPIAYDRLDYRWYGVLSDELESVWKLASGFLGPALKYSDGRYSIDDIYQLIKSKDMQLWCVFGFDMVASVVTQIHVYPRKKVLCVMFCGGVDMGNWVSKIEIIEDFARHKGCSDIEIYGRPGWARCLGWKTIYTYMAKRL